MILKKYSSKVLVSLFFLSFLLWIFCFRGFLSGRLSFTSDSLSYLSHIKYYLMSIRQGIFPLWDLFEASGMPNDFFLRRIGPYNPFIFLPLILNLIGLPYLLAYNIFLTFYYFLGMLGFYLIAKCLFRDTTIAFMAYLLLLFSALGTKMFDSYIILVIVPMVWFFYFLIAFSEKQEKHFLLGITLTLMILATTYIPFYFLTILLTFLICYAMLYLKDLKNILRLYSNFLKNNKFFVFLCVFVIILSLLPGLIFFLETNKNGELSMPERHGALSVPYALNDAPSPNTLAVSDDWRSSWAVIEEIFYASYFNNLEKFELGVFYIPIFAYISLLLGICAIIRKRLIFFFLWGGLLFLIASPTVIPLNRFLVDHIFYFKYFRSLYFFVFLVLLPIFILFITDQLQIFLSYKPQTRFGKYALILFLIFIHLCLGIFLYLTKSINFSSYLVICLSLLFFIFYFLGSLRPHHTIFLAISFALIALQPLEAYYYLGKNSLKNSKPFGQDSNFNYYPSNKIRNSFEQLIKDNNLFDPDEKGVSYTPISQPYIGLNWYYFFIRNFSPEAIRKNLSGLFVLYDRIEWVDDKTLDLKEIENSFRANQNVVYVTGEHSQKQVPLDFAGYRGYGSRPLRISNNYDIFYVVKHNANRLQIKTNFNIPKFLVWNNCFHSNWRASINGKPATVWRANIAFQGLWIPKGENIIVFEYGRWWQYLLNWSLVAVFWIIFLSLCVLSIKSFLSSRRTPSS